MDWIKYVFAANMPRLDLDNFDYNNQKSAYNDALNFAKQNINIDGVKELQEKLHNDFQEYVEQRRRLKVEEYQNESNKYVAWDKVHRVMVIFIIIAITSVMLLLAAFINGSGIFWEIIAILSSISVIITPIAAIILKLVEMISKKKYVSYVESIKGRIKVINYGYLSKVDQIEQQIDDLYLASLSNEHREMVLMRRDQERQHQELVRLQKEQQKMQKKILDEQSRSRKVQEGLLDIEREREERRKRYQ